MNAVFGGDLSQSFVFVQQVLDDLHLEGSGSCFSGYHGMGLGRHALF